MKLFFSLVLIIILATYSYAQSSSEKELYELRTYELKAGADTSKLANYLQEILTPNLIRKGITHTTLFKDYGDSEPSKLWFLIVYPNAEVYIHSQELHKDNTYLRDALSYNSLPIEQRLYNRISSMLLLAVDGLPKMDNLQSDATLFELRTYEGYSEDANQRKIKMFNVEELELFYEVGLHPVFFGDQIAGSNRPCLTYMIQFKDMKEHDDNWKKFVDSPKWKKMVAKNEYAHTASTIHKLFLTRY